MLTPDSELELHQLVRRYGTKAAGEIWEAPCRGIERIVETIKRYDIKAGLLHQVQSERQGHDDEGDLCRSRQSQPSLGSATSRGAVGHCASIERDDIEPEDGRADPDNGHEGAGRPAQCCGAAFIIRHPAKRRFDGEVLPINACHTASSLGLP